jgi:chemotaxis protein MotB
MKKIIRYSTVLSSLVLLFACAPIYKCGETPPSKLKGSKRMKSLTLERDSLCRMNALKDAHKDTLLMQISTLNIKTKELENQKSDLQGKYNELFNENVSQSEKYSATLKMKSDELNNKEKLLSEREKSLKEMKNIISRQDSITNRLNDVLRKALLGFKSDELSVEIKNGKVYVSLSDKLLFKSGSAAVEDKGKQALKLLADVLQKNTDIDILIEGHTDNDPIKTAIYKDNWDLSVGRATSIVRILSEEYKVLPKRVTASGKGEFSPKASNETAEGKAKNRRTEIILSPKLDEIMQLLNERKK